MIRKGTTVHLLDAGLTGVVARSRKGGTEHFVHFPSEQLPDGRESGPWGAWIAEPDIEATT